MSAAGFLCEENDAQYSVITLLLLSALPATPARCEGNNYDIMRATTASWFPKGLQTRTARALVGAEIGITAWHCEACDDPEIEDRAISQRDGSAPADRRAGNGRVLPNLPAVPGAGPGGGETGQDRAVRCAHQAGVYGQAAGDRGTPMSGTCINE